jgi:hypothetical protein
VDYELGGCVTVKGEFYSYGIVILEILNENNPTHNMFIEGTNFQKLVNSAFQT